jgi:hypothetical protein
VLRALSGGAGGRPAEVDTRVAVCLECGTVFSFWIDSDRN